ncbi:MAG: hypothetical protein FJW97_09900 [Actinobacteria bacterium]|nr:hypothetical protein [Actinomycetota bacterium]
MSGQTWALVIGVVVALALLVFYASSTAGRLDRLHRRIDTAVLALDAQALRRSAAAQELALSGLLDPASALLVAQAAHDAREAGDDRTMIDVQRTQLESDVTRALQAALTAEDVEEIRADPAGAVLLEELQAACIRAQLARRFLNDGVRACRQLRSQRLVRWMRLAGRTPWPQTSDWDDEVPTGLAVLSAQGSP